MKHLSSTKCVALLAIGLFTGPCAAIFFPAGAQDIRDVEKRERLRQEQEARDAELRNRALGARLGRYRSTNGTSRLQCATTYHPRTRCTVRLCNGVEVARNCRP